VLAEQLKASDEKATRAESRVRELEALNGAGKGGQAVTTAPADPAAANLGTPPGRDASHEDRKAHAKQEWAANAGGVREVFSDESTYVGYRAAELAGLVSAKKK
jgi:hypothetical protein